MRKGQHLATPPRWFSHKITSEKQTQKFLIDAVTLPRSRFLWLAESLLQPIRSTTQILVVMHYQYGISMLIFLRRHFAGKTVASLQNINFYSGEEKKGPGLCICRKSWNFYLLKSFTLSIFCDINWCGFSPATKMH